MGDRQMQESSGGKRQRAGQAASDESHNEATAGWCYEPMQVQAVHCGGTSRTLSTGRAGQWEVRASRAVGG